MRRIGKFTVALVCAIILAGLTYAQETTPAATGKDYSKASSVSCRLAKTVTSDGLTLLADKGDGKLVAGDVDGTEAQRTDRANKQFYVYFDVDKSFAGENDKKLSITIVGRSVDTAVDTGCNLLIETTDGYKTSSKWWGLPSEAGWQEFTFEVENAKFADQWGWNFRIDVVSSKGDIWIKEVTVKKP